MFRRLTLFATMMVIFASASTVAGAAILEEPSGFVPGPGTNVTFRASGPTVGSGLGTITCSEITFPAKVKANNGGNVEVEGNGTGSATGCTLPGVPLTFVNVRLAIVKSNASTGTGKASASFSFQVVLPVIGACTFTATNVLGTYNAVTFSNVLTFTNVTLSASPAACGPSTFNGNFALTTTTGGGQILIK